MFFETIGIWDTFYNRLDNRIEEVQYFSERQCKWRRLRMAEAENGFSVPEIELIIKASTIDGRRKGACIFCQEYFMDLYLLAGAYFQLLTYNIIPDDHFTLTLYWPLLSFQSWRPSHWRSPQLTWRGHLLTSGSPKIVQQTLLEYYKINSPDMDPVVKWNILY